MRKLILIAVLAFASASQAASIEDCDAVTGIVTTAMDERLRGQPAQDTLRLLDRSHPFWPRWAHIVAAVYEAPPRMLRGPARADVLTGIYRDCLAVEAD